MGTKELLCLTSDTQRMILVSADMLSILVMEINDMRLLPAITITVASLISVPASAASIPGLFNTGQSFSAGMTDTHYKFAQQYSGSGTATGTGGYGVVAPDSGFPIGPWIANTETSKWLAPTVNAAESYDPVQNGLYLWTLSFNLTGYDPSTASFSAQWATDNGGYVKLNNTQLLTGTTDYPIGFTTFSTFSANSGFISGMNTLAFYVTNKVQNGGNPTGLRVEFLQSSITPVPEPETYAMLLAGLGLMGTIARRRKNSPV
jgi:hypothetical protein